MRLTELPSDENVAWPVKARNFITFRKREILDETLAAARDKPLITDLIMAYANQDIETADAIFEHIKPSLPYWNREEALTLELFYIQPRIDFVVTNQILQVSLEDREEILDIAVPSCQRAFEIAREIGDESCEAFYAVAMAICLGQKSEHTESENYYHHGIEIYQKLASKNPEDFTKFVATSLNNLGNAQRALGKVEEAKNSYTQALDLYEELANQDPDVFTKYLVITLSYLGKVQREMQDLSGAEEAFVRSRQLALKSNESSFPHKINLASLQHDLGSVQSDMQKFGEAEESLVECVKLFRELDLELPGNFTKHLASSLGTLGQLYTASQKNTEAKKSITEALEIFLALEEKDPSSLKEEIANALNGLACAEVQSRNFAVAEKLFTESLLIYRRLAIRDPKINEEIAMVLSNWATAQSKLQNYKTSEESLLEALKLYEGCSDKDTRSYKHKLATILGGLGNVQANMGRLTDAELSLARSLQIYRSLALPHSNRNYLAQALNNLGSIQEQLRKYSEAENSFFEAIEIFELLNRKDIRYFSRELANALNGLGHVYFSTGRFVDAEKYSFRAVELYRKLTEEDSDPFIESVNNALINLGNTYRKVAKLSEAERIFIEALEILRRAKNQAGLRSKIGEALLGLGNVQLESRKAEAAKETFSEALLLFTDLAAVEPYLSAKQVVKIHNNLGIVHRMNNNFTEARATLVKGLKNVKNLSEFGPGDVTESTGLILSNLGSVQILLEEFVEAKSSLLEALNLYERLAEKYPQTFKSELVVVLNNLGLVCLKQDLFIEAISYFEKAVGIVEDLRNSFFTIDERRRIFQTNSETYSLLLVTYMRMKDWEKALEIAELGKSRSITDLLNLKAEDLQPKASSPDLAESVQELGRKYSYLFRELQKIESSEKHLQQQIDFFENDIERVTANESQQAYLNELLKRKLMFEIRKQEKQNQRFAAQDELKQTLKEINRYDPHFPPKTKAINSEEIFELSRNKSLSIVMFRHLPESTALIFVFPNGELFIEETENFSRREMVELFTKLWMIPYLNWRDKRISLDQWKSSIEQTLATIYEKLVSHVHRILNEKAKSKEVLFVPNHCLALLPLHAGSWKDETGKKHYLLEEYTISYAPSLSVFKRCQENESERSNMALFVANPTADLAFSEQEVSHIAELHQPYQKLCRKEATRSAVIDALQFDYGFTHFSCHGFYHQQSPLESGLVMADGVINLAEIINCNLQNNWLTVLSACETGMVDFASPTDEHFGLPLGFIFAGSPSVWASLWSVSDLATAELMTEAYKNLNKKDCKDNKPEALRQAQLEMMKEFPHPFFWAGFQHFGV